MEDNVVKSLGVLEKNEVDTNKLKWFGKCDKKIQEAFKSHKPVREIKTILFKSFKELMSHEHFVAIQKFIKEVDSEKTNEYFENIREELGTSFNYDPPSIQFSIKQFNEYIRVIEELFKNGEHLLFTSLRRICLFKEGGVEEQIPIIYNFELKRIFETPQFYLDYICGVMVSCGIFLRVPKVCCGCFKRMYSGNHVQCSECKTCCYCSNMCFQMDKKKHQSLCKKIEVCPVCTNRRILKKCAGCKKKQYCSRRCQKKDWKKHKKDCKK